jgi:hypothetical protein
MQTLLSFCATVSRENYKLMAQATGQSSFPLEVIKDARLNLLECFGI